jgi:hypothetical protein
LLSPIPRSICTLVGFTRSFLEYFCSLTGTSRTSWLFSSPLRACCTDLHHCHRSAPCRFGRARSLARLTSQRMLRRFLCNEKAQPKGFSQGVIDDLPWAVALELIRTAEKGPMTNQFCKSKLAAVLFCGFISSNVSSQTVHSQSWSPSVDDPRIELLKTYWDV